MKINTKKKLSENLVMKYYLHICVYVKDEYDKYVSCKLSFTNIIYSDPVDNSFS